MEVAVDHGGYITTRLAGAVGIPAVELRKMVSRGTLTAVAHGVYRVPALPIERYNEFILACLWANGRGVISHDSALLIHDLCDINPERIHITIPPAHRIDRAGGSHYTIHKAALAESDILQIDGVTLTSVQRTLSDAAQTIPAYLLRQATQTAIERGRVSRPPACH
jgi:predicted transcriptional regulator of viral defense system